MVLFWLRPSVISRAIGQREKAFGDHGKDPVTFASTKQNTYWLEFFPLPPLFISVTTSQPNITQVLLNPVKWFNMN